MKIFFNTISSASAISDGLERSQIRNYGLVQGSNHHTLKSIRGNGRDLNHSKAANIQHHTPSPVLEQAGQEREWGCPRTTCRRGILMELKAQDMTWQDAANLVCWRIVVDSLCFLWNDTSKLSSNLTDIGMNKNALVFTIK